MSDIVNRPAKGLPGQAIINQPISNLVMAKKPSLPLPSQTAGDVIAPADALPIAGIPTKNGMVPAFGTKENASLTPPEQEAPDQMSRRKAFWDTLVEKRDALKSQGLNMYDFPSSKATDEQLNKLVSDNPKLWREYILGQQAKGEPYRFDVLTMQPAADTTVATNQETLGEPPILEIPEGPKGGGVEKGSEATAGGPDILKWLKGAGLGIVDLLQAAAAGSTAGAQKRALDWDAETTIGARDKKKAMEDAEARQTASEEAKFNRGAEFQKQLATLQAQLQANAQAVDNEFKEKMAKAQNAEQAAQAKLDRDAAMARIWAQASAGRQASLPSIGVPLDPLAVRGDIKK